MHIDKLLDSAQIINTVYLLHKILKTAALSHSLFRLLRQKFKAITYFYSQKILGIFQESFKN